MPFFVVTVGAYFVESMKGTGWLPYWKCGHCDSVGENFTLYDSKEKARDAAVASSREHTAAHAREARI